MNRFSGISREPLALVLKSLGPQPKKKKKYIYKKKKEIKKKREKEKKKKRKRKEKGGLAKLLGAKKCFEVVKNPL